LPEAVSRIILKVSQEPAKGAIQGAIGSVCGRRRRAGIFGKAKKFAKKAVKSVKNVASNTVKSVKNVAKDAVKTTKKVAVIAAPIIKKLAVAGCHIALPIVCNKMVDATSIAIKAKLMLYGFPPIATSCILGYVGKKVKMSCKKICRRRQLSVLKRRL